MEGGDVGWTFAKVSEQDFPKLAVVHPCLHFPPPLWHHHTHLQAQHGLHRLHAWTSSIRRASIYFIGTVRWCFERDSTEPAQQGGGVRGG